MADEDERFQLDFFVGTNGARPRGTDCEVLRLDGYDTHSPREATGNAIEMTLLTRDHRGRLIIDAAQLAGAYGSGMISTTWYQSSGGAAAQDSRTGNLNLALMAGINLVREFQPELKRVFGPRLKSIVRS